MKKKLRKKKASVATTSAAELIRRIELFVKENHDTILNQMKKLGASLDWSREAYTLDEKRSLAVRTAFKKMYDEGLIYRGHRVVNWDPKGQTTISDDEIVYTEATASFYTLNIPKIFPFPFPLPVRKPKSATRLWPLSQTMPAIKNSSARNTTPNSPVKKST